VGTSLQSIELVQAGSCDPDQGIRCLTRFVRGLLKAEFFRCQSSRVVVGWPWPLPPRPCLSPGGSSRSSPVVWSSAPLGSDVTTSPDLFLSLRLAFRRTLRSSSPGSRPLAPPCRPALVRPLPVRRCRLPFGQTLPPVWSCSVSAVSLRLDGFLRTRVAGLLRPAASSRFNAFPPRRPRIRGSSGAFGFPALLLPFEGFSSSVAVPHHCGRCLPAVRLSRLHTAFVVLCWDGRLPARLSRNSALVPRRRSGFPVLRAGRGIRSASAPRPSSGVASGFGSWRGLHHVCAWALRSTGHLRPSALREAAPYGFQLPRYASTFPLVWLAPSRWLDPRVRARRGAAVMGPRFSWSSLLSLAGSALSWDLGLELIAPGCFVPRFIRFPS